MNRTATDLAYKSGLPIASQRIAHRIASQAFFENRIAKKSHRVFKEKIASHHTSQIPCDFFAMSCDFFAIFFGGNFEPNSTETFFNFLSQCGTEARQVTLQKDIGVR